MHALASMRLQRTHGRMPSSPRTLPSLLEGSARTDSLLRIRRWRCLALQGHVYSEADWNLAFPRDTGDAYFM